MEDHAMNLAMPSDREIRTERIFDAPRERVWKAFTDAKLVAKWWGRGNPLEVERLDPVRGGRWRFVEHAKEGNFGFEGEFREVAAPERIVQTFGWDGMPGHIIEETLVLESLDDAHTRVVTMSRFHSTEERDQMLSYGMAAGMERSYRALDTLLCAAQS